MNQPTNAVHVLIEEVRTAYETETTIGRILGRTKDPLERFLTDSYSLDQIKELLECVLVRKASPYGQLLRY